MAKPLHGKRIVVTRSPDLAESMCEQLADLGAVPVRFPVLDFVPLPVPKLDLTGYDWLVFTSGNGVRFFFNDELGIRNYESDPLHNSSLIIHNFPRVAAVGEATGRLLVKNGVTVDFMPEVFTGEQLAVGLGDVAGKKILLPRAKIGRPEIVNLLRERGAVVEEIALYDTVTAVPTPTALAELDKGVDVITFTSPSSVRNFLKIVKSARLDGLAKPFGSVACIGPSTAVAAEQQGLTVAIVPDVYTIEGLVTAVAAYFEEELLGY